MTGGKMLDPEIKKIHLAHKNMIDRCYNQNNFSYKHYGGRGISVCDEWKNSRSSFVQWALASGHKIGLSLDRIDTEGDYSPDNCRWATLREQLLNQRRNHLITHNGVTKPLSLWAEEIGIRYDTLFRRISVYGMPTEKALSSKSLKKTAVCGTRAMYEKGCRCSSCKSIHAARHRENRKKRKLRTIKSNAIDIAGYTQLVADRLQGR